MKTVKYKVSKDEMISCISEGEMILNAKIIFSDGYEALIYFPKKLKVMFEGKECAEKSDTGSLSFAVLDDSGKYWKRTYDDYLNITLKKYE